MSSRRAFFTAGLAAASVSAASAAADSTPEPKPLKALLIAFNADQVDAMTFSGALFDWFRECGYTVAFFPFTAGGFEDVPVFEIHDLSNAAPADLAKVEARLDRLL